MKITRAQQRQKNSARSEQSATLPSINGETYVIINTGTHSRSRIKKHRTCNVNWLQPELRGLNDNDSVF